MHTHTLALYNINTYTKKNAFLRIFLHSTLILTIPKRILKYHNLVHLFLKSYFEMLNTVKGAEQMKLIWKYSFKKDMLLNYTPYTKCSLQGTLKRLIVIKHVDPICLLPSFSMSHARSFRTSRTVWIWQRLSPTLICTRSPNPPLAG